MKIKISRKYPSYFLDKNDVLYSFEREIGAAGKTIQIKDVKTNINHRVDRNKLLNEYTPLDNIPDNISN